MGYAGHTQQQGENVIAIIATHGDIVAPVPVAPVHDTAMVLFPESLQALTKVAKEVGLDLSGASRNLDGGLDVAHHQQSMFHAGLIPTITASPRHRTRAKRGRTRLCNAVIPA